MDEKHQNFINEHLNDNINELSLKASRYPDFDMPLVIRQIDARQRIRDKVPSWFEQAAILYPPKLSVEQSSSGLTAAYKLTLLKDIQGVMADLTGGLGVDFSFLSGNFHQSYYIEENETLCELAKHNFEVLGLNNYIIQNTTAQVFLQDTDKLDFIYIDPHRRKASGQKSVKISDCSPDIGVLLPELLSKCSRILIKLSPMLDIHQAANTLQYVSDIDIVAVENECKEVLISINTQKLIDSPPEIHAVNIFKNGKNEKFSFKYEDEKAASIQYAAEPENFIYEPNVSILKAGAFKTIAERFELKKFHPSTHLYTLDRKIDNFLGKIFQLVELFDNSKSAMKMLSQKYPEVTVFLRNYPLSVAEYRKKHKLKDGSSVYVAGLKNIDNKLINIVCKRVQ